MEFVQVRLAQKEILSIAISKPGTLLGLGALLDRQFQIFAFFHPLSRSASGRSGFASKAFLPLEMS